MADQYNGLAIVVNDIDDLDFASLTDKLRINDSQDRMVIYVLDEIEKNSNSSLRSSKFLGFLDGAESRSNTIIIATANDISDMPSFLTNRPGRFEKIYEFSLKDKGILTATIEGILPEKYNTPEIVTEILEKALDNGVKTIDHLRFIVQDLLFAKIKATTGNKKVDKKMNPVDKPAKANKSTAKSKTKVA